MRSIISRRTAYEKAARRFSCVEINSSFYRPHLAKTYDRWTGSVPDDFRFALKLPKQITHTLRLVDAEQPLFRFLDDSAALGVKRDVILVQLPPSFAYDASVVEPFFALVRARYSGRVACEPRHPSWFGPAADEMLKAFLIARVAADPSAIDATTVPAGSDALRYWRLHGSPRPYYSAYDDTQIDAFAQALRAAGAPAWCIFDNTALGAAAANALALLDALAAGSPIHSMQRPGDELQLAGDDLVKSSGLTRR